MPEQWITFLAAFGGALPAVAILGWWLRGQFADMNDKFRHRLYTEINNLDQKLDAHMLEDRNAFEQIRYVLATGYSQPVTQPWRKPEGTKS